MTKSIEEELNLPPLEEAIRDAEAAAEAAGPIEEIDESFEVQQIANALQKMDPGSLKPSDPMGVDVHEQEANEIYSTAMKAHKDLLDLGFNIESKHAGANAFTPALKALELALKASQSKSNKKMERIKLIMEKETHDNDLQKNEEDGVIMGETTDGGTVRAFRNDLVDKIRKGEI